MPLIRLLAHVFLVLALLAGGVAPGAASAADTGEEAPMSSPCHDLPADTVEATPADCCEDGACTCDCLHHAPAGFPSAPFLPQLALLGMNQRPLAAALPQASAAPAIRPPIA